MRDASGLFWVSFMVKAFLGDQRWNRWGRGLKGAKVLFTFLPFYFFTFLLFKFRCSLLYRGW